MERTRRRLPRLTARLSILTVSRDFDSRRVTKRQSEESRGLLATSWPGTSLITGPRFARNPPRPALAHILHRSLAASFPSWFFPSSNHHPSFASPRLLHLIFACTTHNGLPLRVHETTKPTQPPHAALCCHSATLARLIPPSSNGSAAKIYTYQHQHGFRSPARQLLDYYE